MLKPRIIMERSGISVNKSYWLKSCPSCSARAGALVFLQPSEFGSRSDGGRQKIQTWCAACRSGKVREIGRARGGVSWVKGSKRAGTAKSAKRDMGEPSIGRNARDAAKIINLLIKEARRCEGLNG